MVPIVAPISGEVLDVGTGTGELQRSLDNATPIATTADIDSVWIVGDLYPRDQASVRAGQAASITINGYPGLVLHGVVQNISDTVDPVTLTLKVRVVLPNPGYRLKPDMFANMSLTTTAYSVVILMGLTLVPLVLLSMLGDWRMTLIAALTIPFAVLFAFSLMLLTY